MTACLPSCCRYRREWKKNHLYEEKNTLDFIRGGFTPDGGGAVGIAYIKYNATDSLNNRSFIIFAPTRIRPLLSSGHDFWQAPERQISLEEWTRSRRRRRHCGKRETCEKHYLTSNFDSIHHDDKSCLYQQVTGNRPSFPKESFSCGIDSFPATFHYHLLKRRSLLKTGKRVSGQGERVTATVIQLKSHDCRAFVRSSGVNFEASDSQVFAAELSKRQLPCESFQTKYPNGIFFRACMP